MMAPRLRVVEDEDVAQRPVLARVAGWRGWEAMGLAIVSGVTLLVVATVTVTIAMCVQAVWFNILKELMR